MPNECTLASPPPCSNSKTCTHPSNNPQAYVQTSAPTRSRARQQSLPAGGEKKTAPEREGDRAHRPQVLRSSSIGLWWAHGRAVVRSHACVRDTGLIKLSKANLPIYNASRSTRSLKMNDDGPSYVHGCFCENRGLQACFFVRPSFLNPSRRRNDPDVGAEGEQDRQLLLDRGHQSLRSLTQVMSAR